MFSKMLYEFFRHFLIMLNLLPIMFEYTIKTLLNNMLLAVGMGDIDNFAVKIIHQNITSMIIVNITIAI